MSERGDRGWGHLVPGRSLDGRARARPLVLLALASLVLWPAAISAQGLGDAAGRERERREKKATAPAKVFTNKDLSEGGEEDSGADADAVDPEEGKAGEGEDPPGLVKVGAADPLREQLDREREERELAEREWRARFAEARARVREEEARCWHEVVRTEFHQGIPVQMKVQEFIESEELRRTKQELSDLEEEFRRTGLPPGWARE